LPNAGFVFPWLHGLHKDNHIQLGFFASRRKSARKVPECIRGIAIVKTGGDLLSSRLKGAIAPEEILETRGESAFIEIDPREGFSVRNFQIQACKMATVSDIVVYEDGNTSHHEAFSLAREISNAQRKHEIKHGLARGQFNTFILSDNFSEVEEHHPELVVVDSHGSNTGNVADFCYWERYEMCTMSKASEISHNVFLGPTPDPSLPCSLAADQSFDVLIEASDLANIPSSRMLRNLGNVLETLSRQNPLQMEFPSSGSISPPTYSHDEVDGLMEMCKWMYELANPHEVRKAKRRRGSDDEAIELNDMTPAPKFLIHCSDGYTESSLLGLAYYMYAEGVPAHEAWVRLHRDRGRNFFAYPSDAQLLTQIQPRILQESPRWRADIQSLTISPDWMCRLDGSLPSRILPYMYLGNLNHANNPELLAQLGITRILSVGEALSWPEDAAKKLRWSTDRFMMVDRVQDNGIDPLWGEFERCLEFIEAGKKDGGATLVHCRVGVSRSATICIAEVMNEMGLSFPRAYCFVRARRLNVIIQPHLRFTYELLKWEEHQCVRRNQPLRRELEWATVAREIAHMNKPYSSR